MEFNAIRQEILTELQMMMGVIEKKHTMPILGNVLVRAEDNELHLQATDLEVGMISRCPAQVIESGEFTVNARRLQEMLATSSDGQVGFSMNEGSMLDISCGSAKFSVETMVSDDFPAIPSYDFEDALTLGNAFFQDCINKIFFSISGDPHKYTINGGLMKMMGGAMYMVSTDGHRMSVVTRELDHGDLEVSAIIPRKSLGEVKKLLQNEEEDSFKVGFHDSRVFFRIGDRILFSRLIDGRFPDFEKAIPENNPVGFEFERSRLLEVMRRKLVFSSEKAKLVRLSFAPGQLVVVLRNAEFGESVDQIEIDYDGEAFDVGFNVQYVHDFLKNMTADKVKVFLKDSGNQGLFKVDEEEGADYRHVIMPMRLVG